MHSGRFSSPVVGSRMRPVNNGDNRATSLLTSSPPSCLRRKKVVTARESSPSRYNVVGLAPRDFPLRPFWDGTMGKLVETQVASMARLVSTGRPGI